jgi:phosphoribosylamine--glycine ligase
LQAEESGHIHLGEVKREGEILVTSGMYGWTMVVTGHGASIPEAQRGAYGLLDRLLLSNCRYRMDIGDGVQNGELAILKNFGLLDDYW